MALNYKVRRNHFQQCISIESMEIIANAEDSEPIVTSEEVEGQEDD